MEGEIAATVLLVVVVVVVVLVVLVHTVHPAQACSQGAGGMLARIICAASVWEPYTASRPGTARRSLSPLL